MPEYLFTNPSETLFTLFPNNFSTIYPVDGIDLINLPKGKKAIFVNGTYVNDDEKIQQINTYLQHPITRITTFLGLPNRMIDKKQSWRNIGKNFIGWDDTVSPAKKNINLLLSPFIFLFNLISVPFKFAVNLAKLFTEILPKATSDFLLFIWDKSMEFIDKNVNDLHRPTLNSLAKVLPTIILLPLAGSARLAYWIGRAFTSPFENVRDAWEFGKKMGEKGVDSKLGGILFASASIFASVIIYTVFFPFAAKLLAAKIFPLLIKELPVGVTKAAFWLLDKAGPTLSQIGNIWMPASPLALVNGLAVVSGVLIPTLGNAIHKVATVFSNFWHRHPLPSIKDLKMVEVSMPPDPHNNRVRSHKANNKDQRISIRNVFVQAVEQQEADNQKKDNQQDIFAESQNQQPTKNNEQQSDLIQSLDEILKLDDGQPVSEELQNLVDAANTIKKVNLTLSESIDENSNSPETPLVSPDSSSQTIPAPAGSPEIQFEEERIDDEQSSRSSANLPQPSALQYSTVETLFSKQRSSSCENLPKEKDASELLQSSLRSSIGW